MPSMCKVLGSMPNIERIKKRKKENWRQAGRQTNRNDWGESEVESREERN